MNTVKVLMVSIIVIAAIPTIAHARVVKVSYSAYSPLRIVANGADDNVVVKCVDRRPVIVDRTTRKRFRPGGRGDLCIFAADVRIQTGRGDDRVVLTGVRRTKESFGTCGPPSCFFSGFFTYVDSGPGTDRVAGSGWPDLIRGGAGSDVLRGDVGADTIKGQGGNDALFGQAGGDFLDGGLGRDRLSGGPGRDRTQQ